MQKSTEDYAPLPTEAVHAALKRARGRLDGDAGQLLEQMLIYAAAAEFRLAAQARRINELESISITDELTGLMNRRGFLDALERALAHSRRHGERGLVAYIDLDGFKQINDHFGHPSGDAVLQQYATLIRRSIRRSDHAARMGGDEFALLLTHTRPDLIGSVEAKLRRRLGQCTVKAGDSTVSLHASIGVAPYGPESSISELVACADRAMYREKGHSLICAA